MPMTSLPTTPLRKTYTPALPKALRYCTRKLRNLPGAVFALEPLRRAYATAGGEVEVFDFDGAGWLRLNLQEHMQSQIFWYGYYSRDIIMLLDKILHHGMVVFDVGANIGELAIAAANRVGSDGRVLAFEPAPDLVVRLEEHARRNALQQLQVFRYGLFEREETAPLYVESSLFSDGTTHGGLGTLYGTCSRSRRSGSVPLRRLDSVVEEHDIAQVHLVKIDVEGAEFSVLRGACRTIDRHHPDLVIEMNEATANAAGYSCSDMMEWLQERGYRLFRIGRHGKLSTDATEYAGEFQNVFCRHASQAGSI